MAVLRPFRALRPAPEYAQQVAALPYDVMNSQEAKEMAKDNPFSFLHVDRAEIDLPEGTGLYDEAVYRKAASNLRELEDRGILREDPAPCYYIYRQIMGERAQAGIVGCASIDDYESGVIKKHELTVAEKEEDRVRHVDVCDANTGPIFLAFRENAVISDFQSRKMRETAPDSDFTAEDGVRHTVWVISDPEEIRMLEEAFRATPCFYIADGHHRSASAYRVGKKRRDAHPGYTGTEEFNFFLSVVFPSEELSIWDYNRVVRDLGGLTEEEFLERIGASFEISRAEGAVRPPKPHTFGLLLSGTWYLLRAKEGSFDPGDPVERLDVSILQNNLLSPVLGIEDPRTDRRISFVGGVRGLAELEKLVREGCACAFSMYPTTLTDLMDIADAGKIMPPKSTWFEPKLRSGLFIHRLS